MKILVTGSKGTVGIPLVAELKARGHQVYGCDLTHSHELHYVRCDISEYRHVLDMFDRFGPIDLVYNLAAEFGRHNGSDFYEACWRSNAIGMRNILDFQWRQRFRLVHFSSSEIYGDFPGIMDESVPLRFPLRPLNDYAISKFVNEWQILNEAEAHRTETVRVRLFNSYGPGEYYNQYRSVIARFSYYALHGLPYIVHLGHQRSFCYIDDMVRTLANISEHFHSGSCYNIGSEREYDIKDVSDIIHAIVGSETDLVQYEEKEELTTTAKHVDISLAKKELGHKNVVELEEGILRTITWMREVYGK